MYAAAASSDAPAAMPTANYNADPNAPIEYLPEHDVAEMPYPLYASSSTRGVTGTSTERWSASAADDINTQFFGQANVDAIQAQLRDVIKKRLGYVIDRQPDDHLLVIMRYVYMNEARNDGGRAEIKRLNGLVLKEIAPMVASGVMQYLAYIRDASRLPTPIPRAQATSIKGTTTTELFKGF